MLGARSDNSGWRDFSMLGVPANVFKVVLRRDLVLSYRRRSDVLTTLFFFVIVVSLFPFGIGPEANQLRAIAPGILWVAALLASMLSLGRLFSLDYLDGTLEQMLLGAAPLGVIVVAKVLAHWLVSGLPLVLIAPVLGLMFDLPSDQLFVLTVSLALGTPVLSLIGAIGAALTLGLRGGGVLVSLLVLPLYVPVLVFGAGAVGAQAASIGAQSHLYLLGAFLVVSSLFAPWAAAAGLRISLE
jgi:heme exporter protein B